MKKSTFYFYGLIFILSLNSSLQGQKIYFGIMDAIKEQVEEIKKDESVQYRPTVPYNLKIIVSSYTYVTLSWNDSSAYKDGFTIERSLSNWNFSPVATVLPDIYNYTDTGLVTGTTYFYRVRTYYKSLYSDWCNSTEAFTPLPYPVPVTPSNLSLTVVTSTMIALSWQDNSTTESGFSIERREGTGKYISIGTKPTDIVNFIDTTFPGNATYYYRVCAYNSGGNSGFTNEVPIYIRARWTIMVYMAADNDLVNYAKEDLNEIRQAGTIAHNVNVVVQSDFPGTPVKRSYFPPTGTEIKQEIGNVNFSDPTVLSDYIVWAINNYPADQYALVLWDHGGAWYGYGRDDSFNQDTLTLPELATAMAKAAAAIPNFTPLELLGFDACLMANLETMSVFKNYVKYYVASADNEPGDGWNYTGMIINLNLNPWMTGKELGENIVKTYFNYFAQHNLARIRGLTAGLTMSVVDLSQVTSLETKLNQLATSDQQTFTSSGRTEWIPSAKARFFTHNYPWDLGDLQNYTDLLNIQKTNPEIKSATRAISETIKSCVVYNQTGTLQSDSTGISIYYPKSIIDTSYNSIPFTQTYLWDEFLYAYTNIANQDVIPPELSSFTVSVPTLSPGEYNTVSTIPNGDDIAYLGTMCLAHKGKLLPDGNYNKEIFFMTIDTGVIAGINQWYTWNGNGFVAFNSAGESLSTVPIIITPQTYIQNNTTYYLGLMYAAFTSTEIQTDDATLIFELWMTKTGFAGVSTLGIDNELNRIFSLSPGAQVFPKFPVITGRRTMDLVYATNPYYYITISYLSGYGEGYLGLYWTRVPVGTYFQGFTILDYAGNYNQVWQEITVK